MDIKRTGNVPHREPVGPVSKGETQKVTGNKDHMMTIATTIKGLMKNVVLPRSGRHTVSKGGPDKSLQSDVRDVASRVVVQQKRR